MPSLSGCVLDWGQYLYKYSEVRKPFQTKGTIRARFDAADGALYRILRSTVINK